MHADFTNQRKGKAARLTDGARALGTAIAKMGGRLAAGLGTPGAGLLDARVPPVGLDGVDRAAAARTRPQCRGQAIAEPRGRFFGPPVPR